ncbi:hypothetical protein J7T55_010355 [Diaporthe amygdali]|uniref:uncharacterized protein n=1 Tax=Phomopsis amygdali TaxID=1214568 RepID=UPI0022FEE1FB|nr:uncharacterized protein J7T55_010355 [Diaporthe amygdali]KAJ0115533.1 hypothetical protein J7T55_010355 [Diaporthe amygdali]
MAAYHFLCVNYATGDEIILIGFSRGAFTVRYLIKLVQELGLLAGLELGDLHEIFGRWWKTASVRGNVSLNQEGDHPRNRPQIPIKACGLWDTVNSVWSTDLQTEIMGVEHVFHALSLHEHRYDFQVVMASVPDGEQHLEQCWFSGYHGDVGGGREDDALAHLALAWMMGKLDRLIDFNKLAFYQKEMVNSRWRAVLNRDEGRRLTSIAPDSRTLGWRVWETMALPFRKIMNVYRRPGITVPDIHEYIHRSVWKLTSQHSEFLKPCWALKGVTPEDPTNGVRHWTPRESLRRMQETMRKRGKTKTERTFSSAFRMAQAWMMTMEL